MGNKNSSSSGRSGSRTGASSSSSTRGNIDFKITQMMNMGFDTNSCRIALEQCNGNVENAIAFILRQKNQEEMAKKRAATNNRGGGNSTGYSPKNNSGRRGSNNSNNSTASREAMLAAAENRMTWRQTGKASNKKNKSHNNNKRKNVSTVKNNSKNAGTMNKTNNTIDLTLNSNKNNNNKKVASEKPIEKKLTKQAKILSANPIALDTCITIIKTIRDKPNDEKYRKLRWSNKKFERTIRYTPGATDFLVLIGFQKTDEHLFMPRVDIGLLYVASSVLEDQKKSKMYQRKFKEIEFNRIMELLTINSNSALGGMEVQKRKEYLERCPAEPTIGEGQQTKITFVISEKRYTRRFPSDCSLQDSILNWLGSLNSVIPMKIASGEWILKNTTMFPAINMDYDDSKGNTLYALKLWPSGTVELAMYMNEK